MLLGPVPLNPAWWTGVKGRKRHRQLAVVLLLWLPVTPARCVGRPEEECVCVCVNQCLSVRCVLGFLWLSELTVDRVMWKKRLPGERSGSLNSFQHFLLSVFLNLKELLDRACWLWTVPLLCLLRIFEMCVWVCVYIWMQLMFLYDIVMFCIHEVFIETVLNLFTNECYAGSGGGGGSILSCLYSVGGNTLMETNLTAIALWTFWVIILGHLKSTVYYWSVITLLLNRKCCWLSWSHNY